MTKHDIVCDNCGKLLGEVDISEGSPLPKGFLCGKTDQVGTCAYTWNQRKDVQDKYVTDIEQLKDIIREEILKSQKEV